MRHNTRLSSETAYPCHATYLLDRLGQNACFPAIFTPREDAQAVHDRQTHEVGVVGQTRCEQESRLVSDKERRSFDHWCGSLVEWFTPLKVLSGTDISWSTRAI